MAFDDILISDTLGSMKNDLGNDIRRFFRATGMSMKALSDATRIPYSALHRFLKGGADIRLSTADRICDALALELRRAKKGAK